MKYSYNTKIGPLTIYEDNGYITEINFNKTMPDENYAENETIKNCFDEISKYLDGKLKHFTFKFKLSGTDFEKSVYNALLKIPYGEVRSYKDIAIYIKNPKAYRAVGLANNKNKLPIVVPCHRVIGANGKLIGFAGGLDIKAKLLEIEGYLKK